MSDKTVCIISALAFIVMFTGALVFAPDLLRY